MIASNNKLEKIAIAIISLGFIIWSGVFIYRSSFIAIDGKRYFCLFDDAMISMRYAWNFSHGAGLVWNPGERIQGYTNLLMTLLMSLATLVLDKSSAVLFIQILGIGFMLTIAYAGMKLANHMIQGNENAAKYQALVRILSFFGILFYYPLGYWSLMGMETGLLTLLLLFGILAAFEYEQNPKPLFLFLTAGSLGLAYLTRNDSIIFAILIWSYMIWKASNKGIDFKELLRFLPAIFIYFIFVVGQFIFQYSYYGEWEPNTYVLKLTGMPLLARLSNGVGFIKLFLFEISILLILSIIDMIFNFRKRKLLLLSLVLSASAYQVYVGGDPWNYWRMMSPTMPLMIVLFSIAVVALPGRQTSKEYFIRTPMFLKKHEKECGILLLTLTGLLLANAHFVPELLSVQSPYQTQDNQYFVNTALVIDQLTTRDASVGVLWAGSIPYYTGRKAIDFLGKSDRYIANLPPDMSGKISWDGMNSVPGHNKYDLNYSIKILRPTYVQRFAWGSQDLSQWAQTQYVEVEYSGMTVFLLKDSPAVIWNKIHTP
jgi:arabinofuranosyltransferase